MDGMNLDFSPDEREFILKLAEKGDQLFKDIGDDKVEKYGRMNSDELNQLAAMGLIVAATLPPKPLLTCLKAVVLAAYITGYERAEADSIKLDTDVWKI